MKNKKIVMWLVSGLTVLSMALPVHAETFYGDDDWSVKFNDEKEMVSTFSTADINDRVSGMQPGDNVIIELKLKNENAATTDWYMQNKVLYSLEDRSANSKTGGGAYTYRLRYKNHAGAVQTLFDSDTVGGEQDVKVNAMLEGLHGATNALKDYFYLDTVSLGEGGTITLEVALDGETQGNDYQDTLADLEMNFAVELQDDDAAAAGGRRTRAVRTSDERQLPLMAVISGVTGLLLMIYSIYCFKEHDKRKREE